MPSSLDIYGHSPTKTYRPPWNRQQNRGYQRVKTFMHYTLEAGFKLLWLTLTSAPGSDFGSLTYHHQQLRQRVERKMGFKGLQHFQVKTLEGNGVLHVLWAYKPAQGERAKSFYIPQAWLSRQWEELHGAHRVWVKPVSAGEKSKRRLSKYLMSQYVADQSAYVNMSWSWWRTFGFPLRAVWGIFARYYRACDYGSLIRSWEKVFAGWSIRAGPDSWVSLRSIGEHYLRWRSGSENSMFGRPGLPRPGRDKFASWSFLDLALPYSGAVVENYCLDDVD